MEVTSVFTPLVIQHQFHASDTNSSNVIKDGFLTKLVQGKGSVS